MFRHYFNVFRKGTAYKYITMHIAIVIYENPRIMQASTYQVLFRAARPGYHALGDGVRWSGTMGIAFALICLIYYSGFLRFMMLTPFTPWMCWFIWPSVYFPSGARVGDPLSWELCCDSTVWCDSRYRPGTGENIGWIRCRRRAEL